MANAVPPVAGAAAPRWARVRRSRFFIRGVLAVTLVLWAAAFAAIPVALKTIAPADIVGLRLMVSGAIFLPFLLRAWPRAIRPRFKRDWKPILAMAFFGVTAYLLALTFGQRTIGAGETSLIINLTPLVTGLFASLLLKEPFHARLVIGGAMAFSGVALLVTGKNGVLSFDSNALFVLLAMASASLFYVIQRRLTREYSALTLSALAVVIGAALAFPFTPGALGAIAGASTESLLAVLFLGVFSGVVPYIGWAYILSKLPAARAALFLYVIPLIATFLGWLVLGEAVTLGFVLSGAIIVLGVMIGNGLIGPRLFRRKVAITSRKYQGCG